MRAAIAAEPPLGRQHFFRVVCGCPGGLSDAGNLASFFLDFSRNREHEFHESTRIGSVQSLVGIGVIGFRNGNNAVTISLTQLDPVARCVPVNGRRDDY